ncbi:hypothetical protein [Fontibacter flavus]|uniref:Uncharacterized protein n=1 Tax=Fontibacter flavus TaxID=654838 RepID=A0ABV6FZT5_9BACT
MFQACLIGWEDLKTLTKGGKTESCFWRSRTADDLKIAMMESGHEALNQLGAVIFYHIGGIVHIVLAFQSLNESKGIL